MKASTAECLFCARVPLGEVMIHTFDLFEDQEMAKKIAIEAGEILRRAWEKDRYSMCGKSPKGFLAGAIYISSVLNDAKKTQEAVANEIGVSMAMVRTAYKRIIKILPGLDSVQKTICRGDRSTMVKCSKCSEAPGIDDFEVKVHNVGWDGNAFVTIKGICKHRDYVRLKTNTITMRRKCLFFKPFDDPFFDLGDQLRHLHDLWRDKLRGTSTVRALDG